MCRVAGVDVRGIERLGAAVGSPPGRQHPVLDGDDVVHLGAEVVAIQVAEADRQRAADLVAVAGADAPAGGADRLAAGHTRVEQAVLGDVPGEDDVGPVTDPHLAGHRDAARLQAVDLADHAGRVEHDAARHHAGHAVAEDAAGDQRQLPGLATGDHGMAGVRAARVADDDFVILGEDVDEFALGLVAPLQTDDACAGHGEILTEPVKSRRLRT
jgi:hypothetical protein